MLAVDRLQLNTHASARQPVTKGRVQLPMRWGCFGLAVLNRPERVQLPTQNGKNFIYR